jgi:hypothetical protein
MSTLITTTAQIGTIKDAAGNETAMSITSGGVVTMPKRVCWMFTSSGGFTIASTSETAKVNWDTEVVNIGSAWNGTNREFTAPVAGTYRISWGMEFQDGDHARYIASRIYKGGSQIGSCHRQNNPTDQGGNQYDGVDHTHIYTFTASEKWWVVPQSSSTINIAGGYGTYCCGELIG